MIDVNLLNLFEACSRMPSRSRSPLAGGPASVSGSFQTASGMILAPRGPPLTAPQCSSYLSLRIAYLYPLL